MVPFLSPFAVSLTLSCIILSDLRVPSRNVQLVFDVGGSISSFREQGLGLGSGAVVFRLFGSRMRDLEESSSAGRFAGRLGGGRVNLAFFVWRVAPPPPSLGRLARRSGWIRRRGTEDAGFVTGWRTDKSTSGEDVVLPAWGMPPSCWIAESKNPRNLR